MSDRLGQQLGNYRILRVIGQGGFADVYLGQHVYLNTYAAIKVLSAQIQQKDRQTFLTEARTIAGLSHANILRVLEFGVEEHGNIPYLVMEYSTHGTLRQRCAKGARLPLKDAISYVKQVAAALQYAHDRNVIHRDVKPENMLVGNNEEVLLSDFGIAVVSQSSRYQGQQEVAGTVAYMAPEQLQGKALPASDQYALGIVLYEWLSGELPFQGSFAEIGSQHLFTPPPPLRAKVPQLPPAVEQVVEKALAKNPAQRFRNVAVFVEALEQASRGIMPGQLAAGAGNDATSQSQASTYRKPPSGNIPTVTGHHRVEYPSQTQLPVPPPSGPVFTPPPGRMTPQYHTPQSYAPPQGYSTPPPHMVPPMYPPVHVVNVGPQEQKSNKGCLTAAGIVGGIVALLVIVSCIFPSFFTLASLGTYSQQGTGNSGLYGQTSAVGSPPAPAITVTPGVINPNIKLTCGDCNNPIVTTITEINFDVNNQAMRWTITLFNNSGDTQLFRFTEFCLQNIYDQKDTYGPNSNCRASGGITKSYYDNESTAGKTLRTEAIFSFNPFIDVPYKLTAEYNGFSTGTVKFDPVTITFKKDGPPRIEQ